MILKGGDIGLGSEAGVQACTHPHARRTVRNTDLRCMLRIMRRQHRRADRRQTVTVTGSHASNRLRERSRRDNPFQIRSASAVGHPRSHDRTVNVKRDRFAFKPRTVYRALQTCRECHRPTKRPPTVRDLKKGCRTCQHHRQPFRSLTPHKTCILRRRHFHLMERQIRVCANGNWYGSSTGRIRRRGVVIGAVEV